MRNKVIWVVFVIAVIVVAWSLVHRSENQPKIDTTVAPILRAAEDKEAAPAAEEMMEEYDGEMMEKEEMMEEEAPVAE